MEIIIHDLSGPNAFLARQYADVRKHVGNRDRGDVRTRPVAQRGIEALAFEELIDQTDLCGVPISKNFVHYKARETSSGFARHQILPLQFGIARTGSFGKFSGRT